MTDWPTMNTDLATVADGLEAITVRRPGSPGATTVPHALRRRVTAAEADATGGRVTSDDTAWNLPASEATLRPGDQIIDADGERWTVLVVERVTAGARLRCVARRLAVVNGLDDWIRIEQATWTKGDAGALIASWTAAWDGLAARIQPIEAEVASDANRRVLRATHRVYVLEAITVDSSHRVIDSEGRAYAVLGYERPERIDQLLTINVSHIR